MNFVSAKSALLALVVFLGSACVIAVVEQRGGDSEAAEEIHRTLTFPAGGTISIGNFDGDVRITGWEDERIELFARKWWSREPGTRVRFLSWDNLTPRVDIEELGDEVRIRTLSPDREGESIRVDYQLNVPHSIRLKDLLARDGTVVLEDCYGEVVIELRSGEIEATNFSGSLQATVQEGRIYADLYDLREDDRIHLKVRNGDIVVVLDQDVNAHLAGSCPEGAIESDFDFDAPVEEGRFSEQIGEGGASIFLSVLDGKIQIQRR